MADGKEVKNIVGENVRSKRQGMSMSQKTMVAAMNQRGHSMTPSTLSKIEKGSRGVNDMELWSMAQIFRCSVNDLFSKN